MKMILRQVGRFKKDALLCIGMMNKRGNPCPKCLPFVGKILIDDVWSGGSAKDLSLIHI